MTYKLIEVNGERQIVMLETQSLELAKTRYSDVIDSCKAGTYDFYCAFADLKEALVIVLKDENELIVMEEAFH